MKTGQDIVALYARIVAAEKPCPDLEQYDLLHVPEPGNPDQCRKCGGSGMVAVLPGLREKCGGTERGQFHTSAVIGYHLDNGCPGWQAKPPDTEIVVEAILTCDALRDHHGSLPDVYLETNEWDNTRIATIGCGHKADYTAEAKTTLEAILLALAKAIGVDDAS